MAIAPISGATLQQIATPSISPLGIVDSFQKGKQIKMQGEDRKMQLEDRKIEKQIQKMQMSNAELNQALGKQKILGNFGMGVLDTVQKMEAGAIDPIQGQAMWTQARNNLPDKLKEAIPERVQGSQAIMAGMASNDKLLQYLAMKGKENQSSAKPTEAARKRSELIEQGYSDSIATGVGYGMYRSVTTPDGDVLIYDLRNQPDPDNPTIPMTPSQTEALQEEVQSNNGERVIRKGSKAQQRLDKKMEDLGDDLTRSNLPRVESALLAIEDQIKSQIESFKKDGNLDNSEDVPGFGRTGMVPKPILSQKGKDLRASMQKLFSLTLLDRSGTAVSSQELDRLKKEFNTTGFSTDRDLLFAIDAYRTEVDRMKDVITTGYSDDVIKDWNSRSTSYQLPSRGFSKDNALKSGMTGDGKRVYEMPDGNIYYEDGTPYKEDK